MGQQQFPESCRMLLEAQHGVIARWQAADAGLSINTIEARLRSGRWRSPQRGVYAIFTGEPPRIALLWAAVLRAGPRAILSHESAAELDGLRGRPRRSTSPCPDHSMFATSPAPSSTGHIGSSKHVTPACGRPAP